MNIARPNGSEVTSVAFSFYDPEEVKQISVKQIVNPVLFDNLNHPTKGGLYDPALGPFSKQHICATCSLDYFACPGHFGHIVLPCPVYNPMFFPQMYQLLRSACLFCHQFRMSRSETHRFIAKLQLLNKGRFLESKEIDNIPVAAKKSRHQDSMDIDGEDSIMTEDEYIHKLDTFVQTCLKKSIHGHEDYKTTVVNDERKRVIADFYRRATAKKKCENCATFSPTYRKDGFAKIFEKPLTKKQQLYNTVQGRDQANLLVAPAKKAVASDSDSASEHTEDEEEDEDDDAQMSSESDGDKKKKAKKTTKKAKETKPKKSRNIVDSDDEDAMELKDNNKFLTSLHIQDTLQRLFVVEQQMCALLYGANGPQMQKKVSSKVSASIFFLEILPVAPTRFRPASVMGDKLFENPQNEHLGKILNTCERIRDLTSTDKTDKADPAKAAKTNTFKYLIDAWIQLQHDVNSLIDSTKNPTLMRGGKLPPAGIRQGLEKKEGLFRKHMMGKRVNYAARSVISPDVNIETNEIGIPPVFATKLTYPEPVTHYNVKEMRRAVINGPSKWPGAAYVQHEDGALSSLANLSMESRIALANQLLTPQDNHSGASTTSLYPTRTQPTNKKVYRHLRNGDLLLLNRQPTLHKPSIMAHKARVLPGERTIRMHYANCNTYNADFDGDEMNVHFPQNEIARAEAKLIANTDSQYLVPTSGAPLRGLIQDHVVAGVWMTLRGSFFDREEYQHLLYGSLRPEIDKTGKGKILTLPPSIWKPVPLWTGKDIITTILHNLTIGQPPLNMTAGAQVKAQYFGKGGEEESIVQIMDGVLVTGVLDKAQFGAKSFGLVHSCYELYGGEIAGQLLSIFGRLFTRWTQRWAFTCRMDDLRLTPEGDKWRRDLQNGGKEIGTKAALKYAKMECAVDQLKGSKKLQKEFKSKLEVVLRSDEQLAGLDATMKSTVNELTTSVQNACIPNGLLKKFPHNNMQTMTVSGAKGSYVNVTQISCALGQQELEGRRVPIMVSGKSLPSFAPYDSSARAGGYIAGRFLTGIRPQEYYFHCMAGREGLIDTAVKTSRSGYLQRCLIKHLEGLKVGYDQTVRDSDGSILQFHYGEDSLDVIKQAHIHQFKFSAENTLALINKYKPSQVLPQLEQEDALSYNRRVLRKPRKYDPTLSVFSPSFHVGSVSEAFEKKLVEYCEKNPDGIIQQPNGVATKTSERYKGLDTKKFKALMYLRYMNSLVEPGEAVGLLAAQGVGEPSTQMTLNTFHFAGFGAKNVTLGIPRLREIVMTASTKLKTPTMTLNIQPDITESQLQSFCQDTSRLTLAQLIDNVQVTERLISKSAATNQKRHKVFAIRLNLFREDEYLSEYGVSAESVEAVIESQFVKKLETAILRDLRRVYRKTKGADAEEIGKGKKVKSSGSDDFDAPEARPVAGGEDSDGEDVENSDNEGLDGDASAEKSSKRSKQQASYEEPDSDDEEVIKAADKAQKELDGEDSDVDSDESADSEDEVEDEADKRKRQAREQKQAAIREKKNAETRRDREERILAKSPYVKKYSFDTEQGSWCEIEMHFPADTKKLLMVNLVSAVAPTCVLHEIKGIDRVFMSEDEKGTPQIATEGVNLKGIWEYADLIDVNSIYSNDIGAILRTYGVEAARMAIIQEISGVFGAYGIDVDRRHLTLIADYMTFESGFKPFNRMGIESSTSPFLKMSFERTCHFLTQATLHGDFDGLESPSARIVMGKVVEGGTGSFDVMQPLVPESNAA
ncbi:MAG: DNA-directed RNA polymerase I complex large subunit Nuc1 [Linnemannia gamsii]|nr:MAG: DNA-directed RNA polymerase I complex large subunit Nuc1 [Linnemannia gamsii]